MRTSSMSIEEILQEYDPITLQDMKSIRLMNRTDTKFVTTTGRLKELLKLAKGSYFVQEIDGRRIGKYYTMYFDTQHYDMFRQHHCGHTNRQKLRIRSYVESKESFLEVKTKNNHGRTKKKRMVMPEFDPTNPRLDIRFDGHEASLADCEAFIGAQLRYDATTLKESIENRFHRITLVNKQKTERLTIDTDLSFHHLASGQSVSLDHITIIELKRDGLQPSPILGMLRQMRIRRLGFSKYCIGTVLTLPGIPHNRFKQRIHNIEKMQKAANE